jgi:hypothetical protein
MTWLDVRGVREYLSNGQTDESGEPIVSKKVVYHMIDAGLKVSRVGEATPDNQVDRSVILKRRRGQHGGRILTCPEWIDEFVISKATTTNVSAIMAIAERRSA